MLNYNLHNSSHIVPYFWYKTIIYGVMEVESSKTPFTLWQKIPDLSLIRDVLVSDSFYRLH